MKLWIALTIHLACTLASTPATARDDGIIHIYPKLLDTNTAFAMYVINQHYPSELHEPELVANSVIGGTAQISSSIKYEYKIEVLKGNKTEVCDVTFYSKPWLTAPNDLYYTPNSALCIPEIEETTATKTPCEEVTPTSAPAPAPTRYPALHLDDAARGALVYFVEQTNAPRSVAWRNIPYDVTVERKKSKRVAGYIFTFSLRIVPSKCTKPDPSIYGKITLEDCPPLKDSYLVYTGPKCVAKILWYTMDTDKTYKFISFTCPQRKNSNSQG